VLYVTPVGLRESAWLDEVRAAADRLAAAPWLRASVWLLRVSADEGAVTVHTRRPLYDAEMLDVSCEAEACRVPVPVIVLPIAQHAEVEVDAEMLDLLGDEDEEPTRLTATG
jgi:hypothetical protein